MTEPREWIVKTRVQLEGRREYLVVAASDDEAERMALNGDGELIDEQVDYTISEDVIDGRRNLFEIKPPAETRRKESA